jgi:hypothetical protein
MNQSIGGMGWGSRQSQAECMGGSGNCRISNFEFSNNFQFFLLYHTIQFTIFPAATTEMSGSSSGSGSGSDVSYGGSYDSGDSYGSDGPGGAAPAKVAQPTAEPRHAVDALCA